MKQVDWKLFEHSQKKPARKTKTKQNTTISTMKSHKNLKTQST
jgi:hypothetical protein